MQRKFTEDFQGVRDDARSADVAFVVKELKQCLEGLESLFYRLSTETLSVREQYALLRDVDFEEGQDEKRKQTALTKKIEEITTMFPNLDQKLVAIIEEMERYVDFEEDRDEKRKQTALTNKIEEMITNFPNLERKLVQLEAAIIEETERMYNLRVLKSELHFMQEENLAQTIETQNLEILRLKRELAAKESSWLSTWKGWRNPGKTVDIDELLCRIQQL
jgi:hypothetical protein